MRRLWILLALLPSIARAQAYGAPPDFFEQQPADDVIRLAAGGGVNLTPASLGWQLQLAVMGENRDKALLTQIGLGYEVVGTRAPGDTEPTGRVSQVVLNPLTIYGGYGGLRAGAGFDVSYAFLPVGPSAQAATGWGAGGRVGGGLSIHPGGFNLWLLAHYRWLSGDRVGGWFFDVLTGPD